MVGAHKEAHAFNVKEDRLQTSDFLFAFQICWDLSQGAALLAAQTLASAEGSSQKELADP